jgi:hypothetical protein
MDCPEDSSLWPHYDCLMLWFRAAYQRDQAKRELKIYKARYGDTVTTSQA